MSKSLKLTEKVATAATKAATEPVVTLHRQLMYRILADESVDHICGEMSLSLSSFNTLIDSPLFKSELTSLRKKMRDKFLTSSNLSAEERLRELNPTAIKTLTALMITDGVPKTLRRAIAKDIIDYNLKLSADRKKGTLSESTAFIIKASERAKARKRKELELAKAAEQSAADYEGVLPRFQLLRCPPVKINCLRKYRKQFC